MIAIENMEMPKSCTSCDFVISDGDSYKCKRQPMHDEIGRPLRDMYKTSRYNSFGTWEDKVGCPLKEIVTCNKCEKCSKSDIESVTWYWCSVYNCDTDENNFCKYGK